MSYPIAYKHRYHCIILLILQNREDEKATMTDHAIFLTMAKESQTSALHASLFQTLMDDIKQNGAVLGLDHPAVAENVNAL